MMLEVKFLEVDADCNILDGLKVLNTKEYAEVMKKLHWNHLWMDMYILLDFQEVL